MPKSKFWEKIRGVVEKKFLFTKTLKIFQKAQKMREEMLSKFTPLSPNMDIADRQTSTKNCWPSEISKLSARFSRWRINKTFYFYYVFTFRQCSLKKQCQQLGYQLEIFHHFYHYRFFKNS